MSDLADGSAAQATRDRVRGIALVLTGVVSVQFGAAVAATLFPLIGPAATVGLRLSIAAVLLVAVGGFRVRDRRPVELALAAGLGLSMAGMVLSLYEAIERMPLGVVITIEFLGPLAVAIVLSRRWSDVLLAALAASGVVVLTGGLAGAEVGGVLFALGAAAGWACYIAFNRSLGRRRVNGALPLAAVVAALAVAPWALVQPGRALLEPRVLLLGLVVAVLSSVVPHSADMRALRWVPARLFGVMMSLHPAVAAVAGFIVLGQTLEWNEWAGMALVVAASAGAAWTTRRLAEPPAEVAADGLNA